MGAVSERVSITSVGFRWQWIRCPCTDSASAADLERQRGDRRSADRVDPDGTGLSAWCITKTRDSGRAQRWMRFADAGRPSENTLRRGRSARDAPAPMPRSRRSPREQEKVSLPSLPSDGEAPGESAAAVRVAVLVRTRSPRRRRAFRSPPRRPTPCAGMGTCEAKATESHRSSPVAHAQKSHLGPPHPPPSHPLSLGSG